MKVLIVSTSTLPSSPSEPVYVAGAVSQARQLIPDIQTEIIPNANHIGEYTAAEWVNAKILDFLAR